MMTEHEKEIFDIIMENSINERMDKTILNNEDYIRIQEKISKCNERLDGLDLTQDERIIIDRLICAHAESGAFYGEMTYKQGFYDCVSLFKELDLIKAS